MITVLYAVVSALIALGILIVFHELGHFLVAKKTGVGVLTFSIGFGPKIFGKKVGETEYLVSAFPLGGYVKMVGEDPEQEVQEVDNERSFSNQSLTKRFAIVAAGPVFNFILSILVFTLIFVFFGMPVLTTQIGSVESNSPAERAGLQKGDRILSIGTRPIEKWEDLSMQIKESGGKSLVLRVERDGGQIDISVQPMAREGRTVFGEKTTFWVVGIASDVVIQKSNPLMGMWQGVYKTGEYSVLTLVALYKMVTGDISPKNLGGPLLIAQLAGEQARQGLWNFLFFVAILSVNLGVLNLLPIPILDGGHLFFFLLEGMRGRPVALRHRERAQQVGVFLLILIMIYAFYNDIARFFES
jgi:regulator of sigma E protease